MAAGWLAIAIGVVAVTTVLSLIAFFTVGDPFGSINDAGNALIAILSAALALLLIRQARGWAGVVVVTIGAGIAVWGSWLVMTGTTGFVLAGFVSTIGFGFVGAWLALLAWAPISAEWPDFVRGLARAAAVAMIVGGLVAIPAALMRIDAFERMPPWMWLFSVGWLGVYVLYPVVAIALGRRLISP